MRRIMGIGCFARFKIGELRRYGLTEHQAPCVPHPGHARRIRRRAVSLVDGGAVCGWHVDGIEDVLDGDGDAAKRPVRGVVVGVAGGIERLTWRQELPGTDRVLALLDALQTGGNQLLRGQAPRPDPAQCLDRSQFVGLLRRHYPVFQRRAISVYASTASPILSTKQYSSV